MQFSDITWTKNPTNRVAYVDGINVRLLIKPDLDSMNRNICKLFVENYKANYKTIYKSDIRGIIDWIDKHLDSIIKMNRDAYSVLDIFDDYVRHYNVQNK